MLDSPAWRTSKAPGVRFNHLTYFTDVHFTDQALFQDAQFITEASFERAQFNGEVDLREVHFTARGTGGFRFQSAIPGKGEDPNFLYLTQA